MLSVSKHLYRASNELLLRYRCFDTLSMTLKEAAHCYQQLPFSTYSALALI
ncbi:MAG: hypothetical protein JWR44_1526 [Hymenobacter sp.]|jgi:hypothetical protein|nr:hypothetical protein [Hymenobacter sp.]